MLISSAEMVILNCISGIAWVACKSGKDRTGGALIANDAAAAFYELKKRHPRHDDDKQDRALYLELLKNFFKSGHHQHVASENAPGAEGLVKFSNYAPSDLLNVKNIRLETQFARLNKPKNIKISHDEPFNHRILKDELRSLKDKTIKVMIGQNVTLKDWRKNWEVYFIDGKSVKELRGGEGNEFKDEKDLSNFMETYLLAEIADQKLKKHYLALALYSFHHHGFLHAFSSVSTKLINDCYNYKEYEEGAIIEQSNMQINLSWVKGRGIQIEEINTYKEKKYLNKEDPIEEGDYCQTYSCVLLNLNAVKDKGYKLAVNIQSAYVNCTETLLKSVFFSKKTNLLEAFIYFLQSLLVAIKRCFDKLVKPYLVLDESWISKTNATFFKKSTETTMNEESNILQREPNVPVFLS
jgi:organic radical activating enzyme